MTEQITIDSKSFIYQKKLSFEMISKLTKKGTQINQQLLYKYLSNGFRIVERHGAHLYLYSIKHEYCLFV